MLEFCKYAQWVPDSDVVVVQGRIRHAQHRHVEGYNFPIKGDVEDIESEEDDIIDEGMSQVSYAPTRHSWLWIRNPEKDYQKGIGILARRSSRGRRRRCGSSSPLHCRSSSLRSPSSATPSLNVAKSRYLHKANKLLKENKTQTTTARGVEP